MFLYLHLVIEKILQVMGPKESSQLFELLVPLLYIPIYTSAATKRRYSLVEIVCL